MSKRYSKKLAFTLAEIIIVLGIVGIIAEMTIPGLVTSYQETATLAGLKKTYATLTTVFQNAIMENGKTNAWPLTVAGDYTEGAAVITNYILPQLKVSKNCGFINWGQPTKGCWAYGYYIDGSNGANGPPDGCLSVTLSDGTNLCFANVSNPTTHYYFRIYADINGLKKPNRYGKDRFVFVAGYRTYDKVEPYGTDNLYPTINEPDRDACWNSGADPGDFGSAGTGLLCSYTIIKRDNWQIADDYPF